MEKMLIAGNWKMNTDAGEAEFLARSINENLSGLNIENKFQGYLKILVCPPFINIPIVGNEIKNSNILLGAQNCSDKLSGAYTGEISIPMLKYYGCEYVIIGHSERRQYYHETDKSVNDKLKTIINSGIKAIVCIGEILEERKSGKTFEVLERQIHEGLMDINYSFYNQIVIAYEPVWAIGTGISAEAYQVSEAHEFIRNELKGLFSENASEMIIQYGGSVNEQNAKEILSLKDVNGALIGGASLKSTSFLSIIKSAMAVLEKE